MSDDDDKLFRSAMRGVAPLHHEKRVQRASITSKKAAPLQEWEPRQAPLPDTLSDQITGECPEHLHFQRPGIQNALMKQLRNGKLPIEDSIDLHGNTRAQAREYLLDFLDGCIDHGLRYVCIVHGKGYRSSKKKPVIKSLLNQWLRQVDVVLAFCSAQPKDGGTGAVYVLLKQRSLD